MENQEKNLSADESLAIIDKMINNAKGNITDNSFYLLLWGWVIALANVGHYLLHKLQVTDHPQMIWLITLPAAVVSMVYGYRKGKQSGAHTYTDRVSMWLWIALFVCILTLIVFIAKINFMITPIVMLFTGFATFTSGVMIKFKPLIIGGLVFWASSVAGFLSPYDIQLLIASLAMILGYLVPGHLLKRHKGSNG